MTTSRVYTVVVPVTMSVSISFVADSNEALSKSDAIEIAESISYSLPATDVEFEKNNSFYDVVVEVEDFQQHREVVSGHVFHGSRNSIDFYVD